MTTLIYGNGNNFSVSDDNSNGDTIILGTSSISGYDMITLGNGAGGARLGHRAGHGARKEKLGTGSRRF